MRIIVEILADTVNDHLGEFYKEEAIPLKIRLIIK
jgi:hypothetical protein